MFFPEKSKFLESWIWDAAYSIRGAKDAPNGAERHRLPDKAARRVSAEARIKYKDYIPSLTFTKRLGLEDVEADIIGKCWRNSTNANKPSWNSPSPPVPSPTGRFRRSSVSSKIPPCANSSSS